MPTFSNASEYLFKSTPSSKVSPNFKPWIRANKVFNALPTTSALSLVFEVNVVNAAVAYS
jgi:hypothetical protein